MMENEIGYFGLTPHVEE